MARSWEDLRRDLRHYMLQLQILQRHFRDSRWVLKSPEAAASMSAFLETQQGGKHTKHRYAGEAFGLDQAVLMDRMAEYRERFKEFF